MLINVWGALHHLIIFISLLAIKGGGDYMLQTDAVALDDYLTWYVGGSVFIAWDNGPGARLSLGLNIAFNAKGAAYVQMSPALGFDQGKTARLI